MNSQTSPTAEHWGRYGLDQELTTRNMALCHAQMVSTGVLARSQPRLTDPLELAIMDPEASIYEVIKLAEARA